MIDASAELFRRVISNILIGDPITSKGLDAYQTLGINTTEETYLKEIYVEPFTIWHREVSKETPDQNNDPDVEITYREEVERNSLLSIKTD